MKISKLVLYIAVFILGYFVSCQVGKNNTDKKVLEYEMALEQNEALEDSLGKQYTDLETRYKDIFAHLVATKDSLETQRTENARRAATQTANIRRRRNDHLLNRPNLLTSNYKKYEYIKNAHSN